MRIHAFFLGLLFISHPIFAETLSSEEDEKTAVKGYPVTMTFGSDYNEFDAKVVEAMLNDACKPLTVKWEPRFENGILIEANGEKTGATQRSYAAVLAETICLIDDDKDAITRP